MLQIQSHCSRALIGSAAALMTLGATRADVLIDEFSDVDIFENPWPYLQIAGSGPEVFEAVGEGVIQGDSGRIRETDITNVRFDNPGRDHAEMGVATTSGTFDHTATPGVANIVQFSYGWVIVNDLNADLSAEKGLRVDLADLKPDSGGYLQISARLGDGNGVSSESGLFFVAEPGAHSVLLPFVGFDAAGIVDLTDIGAIEISLYASPGTDFSIERLLAARPDPGDANADGVVNLTDLMAVLGGWGDCPGCLEDFDDDGVIGIIDFLIVLGHWD